MRLWTTDLSYNDFFNRLTPSTHLLRCIAFSLSGFGMTDTIATRAMGPALRSLVVAENRPLLRPDGS
jgi:hypothetical protein